MNSNEYDELSYQQEILTSKNDSYAVRVVVEKAMETPGSVEPIMPNPV